MWRAVLAGPTFLSAPQFQSRSSTAEHMVKSAIKAAASSTPLDRQHGTHGRLQSGPLAPVGRVARGARGAQARQHGLLELSARPSVLAAAAAGAKPTAPRLARESLEPGLTLTGCGRAPAVLGSFTFTVMGPLSRPGILGPHRCTDARSSCALHLRRLRKPRCLAVKRPPVVPVVHAEARGAHCTSGAQSCAMCKSRATSAAEAALSSRKTGARARWVAAVEADAVWLALSASLRGRAHALDAAADLTALRDLPAHFPLGRPLRCRVLQVRPAAAHACAEMCRVCAVRCLRVRAAGARLRVLRLRESRCTSNACSASRLGRGLRCTRGTAARNDPKAAPRAEQAARAQVVQGKRPTIDLTLRGAGDATADAPPAPGALLCGLVTQVSGARGCCTVGLG
jgi:hypothetical protein